MDFAYEVLDRRHFDEVYNFFCTDFLYEEPLKAMLKVTEEEAAAAFRARIEHSLADSISYVVRNEEGQIVGVRLASIVRRPTDGGAVNSESSLVSFQGLSPKFEEIRRFAEAFESQLWKLLPPDIDTVVSGDVLSVAKAYCRRGIAQKLVTIGLDDLRARGCQGVYVGASAYQSQALFEKNGYEPLFEMRFDEWKWPGSLGLHSDVKNDKVVLYFRRL